MNVLAREGSPAPPGSRGKKRPHRATPIWLALLLATSTTALGHSMKQPDIKLNPAPRKRYDVILTIDGAPGPFDTVTAVVDFKITNDRCVPLTPVIGATLAPEKRVPIALTQIGDQVYRGSFYADMLQDEDYYGMGVCHWGVVGASVDLKVKKVDFNPAIFMSEILARKPVTRYFAKRSYLYADIERVDIGNASRADFLQDAHDTFAITLQAEEAAP